MLQYLNYMALSIKCDLGKTETNPTMDKGILYLLLEEDLCVIWTMCSFIVENKSIIL